MEIYYLGKIRSSQMNLEIPTSVTKFLNICTLKILYRTQYTGQRLIQMASNLCTYWKDNSAAELYICNVVLHPCPAVFLSSRVLGFSREYCAEYCAVLVRLETGSYEWVTAASRPHFQIHFVTKAHILSPSLFLFLTLSLSHTHTHVVTWNIGFWKSNLSC